VRYRHALDTRAHLDKKCHSRDELRLVEVFSARRQPGQHRVGRSCRRRYSRHSGRSYSLCRDRALAGDQRDCLVVSDTILPAADCAQAIRQHWSIENRSHYVRDVTFAEDARRIRCNPGIFARLRSFAANILRFNNVSNVSNARYRIAFAESMLSSTCASCIER